VNRLAGLVMSYVEACRPGYVVLTYTHDVFTRSTSNCNDPTKLQNGQRPDQTLPIARRFRLSSFVLRDKMSVTQPSTKKARTRALPFRDFFSFLRPLAAGSSAATAARSPYLLAEPKCGKTRSNPIGGVFPTSPTHDQRSLLLAIRSLLSLLHGSYPTRSERERSSRSAISIAYSCACALTLVARP
jgi:hypothetical protein